MEMKPPTPEGRKLAAAIDHTILKPQATESDVRRLCDEAVFYRFASVCVTPFFVPLVARALAGSPIKPCTVVGFPLGCNTCATKEAETREALAAGAEEIDMVLSLPAMKAGDHPYVLKEIQAVVKAARGQVVKVIIETHLLTDAEKETACRIIKDAGAHFVKTSTGFTGGGATVEDIRLMRRVVGPHFGVKASGGIRTFDDARRMQEAGATRIGTSAAVAMVT